MNIVVYGFFLMSDLKNMIEIEEFKLILEKNNINLSEISDVSFLHEFSEMITDNILDKWIEKTQNKKCDNIKNI